MIGAGRMCPVVTREFAGVRLKRSDVPVSDDARSGFSQAF
jgi:hypothetical protein